VFNSGRCSVESVGISDSTIYLCYAEALIDEARSHTSDDFELRRFVIIDVSTDSVEWYETREDWLTAFNKQNIVNPKCHQVDSVYDDFTTNGQLLFDPKTIKR